LQNQERIGVASLIELFRTEQQQELTTQEAEAIIAKHSMCDDLNMEDFQSLMLSEFNSIEKEVMMNDVSKYKNKTIQSQNT
jgi:hypothetical protein